MLTYAQRQLSLQLERVATEMLRQDSLYPVPQQKKQHKVSSKLFAITGPKIVPHCGCNVQPWEDCIHTT